MKPYKYFFSAFCMTFFSCNSTYTESERVTNINGKPMIQGFWRFVDDDFVHMVIEEDSIFYPDINQRRKYTTKKDLILIFEDDYIDTIKYEMSGKDTLLFHLNNGTQVNIRNSE